MLAPKVTQVKVISYTNVRVKYNIFKTSLLANIGNSRWNVLRNRNIFLMTIKVIISKLIMEIGFCVDNFTSEKNTSRGNHFVNR